MLVLPFAGKKFLAACAPGMVLGNGRHGEVPVKSNNLDLRDADDDSACETNKIAQKRSKNG